MCRISIITASDISRYHAGMLMNDLMLRSNADTQPDGWGVYLDNNAIFDKSYAPYWHSNSKWMHDYMFEKDGNNNGIMLGHVRAASLNTGRSAKESHPFIFLNSDGTTRFVAAHNGQINGTYAPYTYNADDPIVDSYRAFSKLSEMLGDEGEITAALVDTWMALYEHDSAFVITIIRNGKLYLFRNDKRPIHFSTLGNGFVFNTSIAVLGATRDYAQHVLNLDISEPKLIAEKRLFEINLGEHTAMASDLALRMIIPNWKQSRVNLPGGTTTTTPAPRSDIEIYVAPTVDEGDTEPWWIVDTNVRPYKKDDPLWNEIRGLLNPCRAGLASLYAVMFTHANVIDDDIVNEYGRAKINPSWQSLTEPQLLAFRDHLQSRPLSGDQRRVINKWNSLIDRNVEVDEQIYAFGATLFFHLPTAFTEEYLSEITERAA